MSIDWPEIEIKVRKRNVEGLEESYFSETTNVEIDLNEIKRDVIESLVTDVENAWDCYTWNQLVDPNLNQNGPADYEKIVHYIVLGHIASKGINRIIKKEAALKRKLEVK